MKTRSMVRGVLIVAAMLVAVWLMYGQLAPDPIRQADANSGESSPAVRVVPVVLTMSSTRTFEDCLSIQGTVKAKTYATVAARLGGTLDTLYVDEGDRVEAGSTRLFQVDRLKAEQAVDISRQQLAAAEAGRREAAANMEQVEAGLEKSTADVRRFEDLHAQRAVSLDALEQQQARHKQAVAQRKHAASLIDMAEEQVRQARGALAIAEKDLSDAEVVAPIDGYVTERFLKEGEMAECGTAVVRIEDPSVVEVSGHLPADYYPRVVIGKTQMRVVVYGVEAGTHTVSYKSPVIDPLLRTFEVKCLIASPPADVVPGAMAAIAVVFDTREAPGVPSESIVIRDDAPAVFTVEHEAARLIPVHVGLQTDGWVEVLEGAVPDGAPIVTQGQTMLDDGTAIAIRQERS